MRRGWGLGHLTEFPDELTKATASAHRQYQIMEFQKLAYVARDVENEPRLTPPPGWTVWRESGPPPVPGQAPAAAAAAVPRLPAIAILTHEFWQKHFGSDRNVVGRSIDFGNGKAQIVGVLSPGFELLFPPKAGLDRAPEVWTAMR